MIDALISIANVLLECLGVAVFLAVCVYIFRTVAERKE